MLVAFVEAAEFLPAHAIAVEIPLIVRVSVVVARWTLAVVVVRRVPVVVTMFAALRL